MGWTSFSMREPVSNWFKNQWNYPESDYEVLDCAVVKRSTIYGAVRKKSTGEVFCAVFLIRWSRGYYNFSYKDMTEYAGPGDCECPERIFKLLTPLVDDEHGWAKEWRERVQRHLTSRKKLSEGYVLETEKPVMFTSGFEYQHFIRIGQKFYVARNTTKDGSFTNTGIRVRFNPFYKNYKILDEKFVGTDN